MLKRIITIFTILFLLGCSKSAQDNNMLIGNPWMFTYFNGSINSGTSMSLSFFKNKNTTGTATFTLLDTFNGAIHKRTAVFKYGISNNGTEIKFTPEDSAHNLLSKGSGLWSILNISNSNLQLGFEDDTTHNTTVSLQR